MINAIILISGVGTNATSIIKETKFGILKNKINIRYVISNNKKASGIEKIKELNIKTFTIPSKNLTRKEHEKLILKCMKEQNTNIDLIILAGYMRILSPHFVNLYKDKIINIHPADTEKYKGLNGYKWAYKNKLEHTFITVHFVDEGVDSGKIIAKKKININNLTLNQIIKKGKKIENKFYPQIINQLLD